MSAATLSDRRRWVALAILAVAQFMVILDATIVNVALPSIRVSLGFSTADLQWVLNAYTLMFGGLLLLGGRTADLLGRRRVFIAGLTLFGLASLVGGLSGSQAVLIGARAVQGLGAALLSPAALSIVTRLFAAGRERNTALGIWGALAGLGGTFGVVAGGVLVQWAGWEWVFFVNVPIAAATVPLALALVPESRAGERGRFDAAGALSATAGLLALVYAVVQTSSWGWGSPKTIALLGAAAALLALFVWIESRAAQPLLPLGLLRSRAMRASNLALLLAGAGFVPMFFLAALSMQSVLGMSALRTGFAFVPMGFAAIGAATLGPQVVNRVGVRPVYIAGSVISVAGLALLSRLHAGDAYAAAILPGIVIFGVGLPLCGIPNTILAVSDAGEHDAGLASGLVNAVQQIGGAIGLAVVVAVVTAHTAHLAHAGAAPVAALAGGFGRGFALTAGFALAGLLVALVLTPRARPALDAGAQAEVVAAS